MPDVPNKIPKIEGLDNNLCLQKLWIAGNPIGIFENHMQAHHLISQEGIKQSGMGDELVLRGYIINDIENLVLIPCTLPGAYFLGVQPHRGDHKHKDDENPESYHEHVRLKIDGLQERLLKCEKSSIESKKKVDKLMHDASSLILDRIAAFTLPLSSIFLNFKPSSEAGCRDCVDVKEYEKLVENNPLHACESKRDHSRQEHPMYKSGKYPEKIVVNTVTNKYFENEQYQLEVGR